MNKWIKFSMHNTGVIVLAMLMILAGGVYSVVDMKQENMPNVDIPYLSVVVLYPGANPRQALDDVGKPLEQALSGINNVKNLYVTSGSDYVAATLEFDMKQSMSDAEKDVTSALAGLKLPDGAQKPQISKQGPNAEAVYSFGITANTDQASIQQYVEDHIKPVLAWPGSLVPARVVLSVARVDWSAKRAMDRPLMPWMSWIWPCKSIWPLVRLPTPWPNLPMEEPRELKPSPTLLKASVRLLMSWSTTIKSRFLASSRELIFLPTSTFKPLSARVT